MGELQGVGIAASCKPLPLEWLEDLRTNCYCFRLDTAVARA
jgi:hypothetical protein